jgi:hypothetical protein
MPHFEVCSTHSVNTQSLTVTSSAVAGEMSNVCRAAFCYTHLHFVNVCRGEIWRGQRTRLDDWCLPFPLSPFRQVRAPMLIFSPWSVIRTVQSAWPINLTMERSIRRCSRGNWRRGVRVPTKRGGKLCLQSHKRRRCQRTLIWHLQL